MAAKRAPDRPEHQILKIKLKEKGRKISYHMILGTWSEEKKKWETMGKEEMNAEDPTPLNDGSEKRGQRKGNIVRKIQQEIFSKRKDESRMTVPPNAKACK